MLVFDHHLLPTPVLTFNSPVVLSESDSRHASDTTAATGLSMGYVLHSYSILAVH
jgi:hypothetical protein